VKYGKTLQDFEVIVDETEEWQGKGVIVEDENLYPIALQEASKAEYFNKKIESQVLVVGKDLAPYILPKKVTINCSGRSAKCVGCAVFINDGTLEMEFTNNDACLLSMVGINNSAMKGVIKAKAGITNCPHPEVVVTDTLNVEDVSCIADVEYSAGKVNESEYVLRRVLYVGHGIRPNTKYIIRGKVCPDPKTQYATILVKDAEPTQDSIDKFTTGNGVTKELRIFQTKE
jgi:hypothetical protein